MVAERRAARFRDLIVWLKAHELVLGVYFLDYGISPARDVRLGFPDETSGCLDSSEYRRGLLQAGKRDQARFLNVTEASLEESRCYLILAHDLGYGDTTTLLDSLEEVSRLLNSYAAAILSSGH